MKKLQWEMIEFWVSCWVSEWGNGKLRSNLTYTPDYKKAVLRKHRKEDN